MSDGSGPRWTILGTTFHLTSAPPVVAECLLSILRPFTVSHQPGAETDVFVTVEGEPESPGMAWLSHFGGLEQTVSLARTTAGEVEYVMVREAVAGARTHLVLHAAALRQGDGAVLVTGESGAGKTTLSLLLRAEGLTLLSDDLCPLDPVSGLISPLPRPLHLDGTYPPEALVGLPDPLPGLDPDRSPFPFEPESHPERQVPGGVHVILALERGDGGPDTVQALTGAETTQLLLRSLIRSRGTHLPEVIPALAGLARSARAWRIMSSTPHGALQCALRVLNRRVTDGAGSHS